MEYDSPLNVVPPLSLFLNEIKRRSEFTPDLWLKSSAHQNAIVTCKQGWKDLVSPGKLARSLPWGPWVGADFRMPYFSALMDQPTPSIPAVMRTARAVTGVTIRSRAASFRDQTPPERSEAGGDERGHQGEFTLIPRALQSDPWKVPHSLSSHPRPAHRSRKPGRANRPTTTARKESEALIIRPPGQDGQEYDGQKEYETDNGKMVE